MLRNQTATEPARMRAALAGLKAYQGAPRPARPSEPRLAGRIGRVSLHAFGNGGQPVLFVPSLINGSEILDLSVENSMMRGLAARGLDPILLDWGTPASDERDLDIGGHVERYILPALAMVGSDALLAGYCLGGTMSIAAAALHSVKGLILVAAPWDYGGFSSQTRNELRALWQAAEPAANGFGLLPAEVLQQIFWRIDPERTIAKFEQFAGKDPASPEGQNYVAVEDWANDGPPLTFAAGRDLMEEFIGGNRTGAGQWQVGGRTIDPAAFRFPLLNVLSTIDRITPATSGWAGGKRIALAEGHVGMVVGRRAPGSLWKLLAEWVSKQAPRKGS
jgi:polyhydroxyalkanoate synthase